MVCTDTVHLEEWAPSNFNLGIINLHVAKLTTLRFGNPPAKGKPAPVQQGGVHFAAETITRNSGKYGSVCFVIRRPGCGLCREEALALKSLASEKDGPLRGFRIFGIVKEFGVDNEGLSSFHSDYFPFPMYKDEDMAFYKAFGMRKLSMKDVSGINSACNPLNSFSEWKRIAVRLKKKGITTNFKGEGFIQGGLLLIGPDAKVKYAYKEDTGEEPPTEHVASGAMSIREAEKKRKRALKDKNHETYALAEDLVSLVGGKETTGERSVGRDRCDKQREITERQTSLFQQPKHPDTRGNRMSVGPNESSQSTHGKTKTCNDNVNRSTMEASDDLQLDKHRTDARRKGGRTARRHSISYDKKVTSFSPVKSPEEKQTGNMVHINMMSSSPLGNAKTSRPGIKSMDDAVSFLRQGKLSYGKDTAIQDDVRLDHLLKHQDDPSNKRTRARRRHSISSSNHVTDTFRDSLGDARNTGVSEIKQSRYHTKDGSPSTNDNHETDPAAKTEEDCRKKKPDFHEMLQSAKNDKRHGRTAATHYHIERHIRVDPNLSVGRAVRRQSLGYSRPIVHRETTKTYELY